MWNSCHPSGGKDFVVACYCFVFMQERKILMNVKLGLERVTGQDQPSPWGNPVSPRKKLGPQDLCLCQWTQGSAGPEKPFIKLGWAARLASKTRGDTQHWLQCPCTFCGCRNPVKFLASKLISQACPGMPPQVQGQSSPAGARLRTGGGEHS